MRHFSRICVVCEEYTSPKFALCKECRQEHGDLKKDQPEWVRFLVNDYLRMLRIEKRDRKALEDSYEYDDSDKIVKKIF